MSEAAQALVGLHRRAPDFALRNIGEALAVIAGAKAVMRLVLTASSAPSVADALRAMGLSVAVSPWRLRQAYVTTLHDTFTEIVSAAQAPEGSCVLAVARQEEAAQSFLTAEHDGDESLVAHLLGYPSCCARAYGDLSDRRDWLTALLDSSPTATTYPHQANRIAYLFDEAWLGFDYFPCGLHCAETAALAEGVAELLGRHGLEDLVCAARASMRAPILIRQGVLAQLVGARVQGTRVTYRLDLARLFGWRVQPEADQDRAWRTDTAIREAGELQLWREAELMVRGGEEQLDNRLLLFS
jgi:hypothetical protein